MSSILDALVPTYREVINSELIIVWLFWKFYFIAVNVTGVWSAEYNRW